MTFLVYVFSIYSLSAPYVINKQTDVACRDAAADYRVHAKHVATTDKSFAKLHSAFAIW